MRALILFVACLVAAASTASSLPARQDDPMKPMSAGQRDRALDVVRLAADSLVGRHRRMPSGGWAWRSAMQAPHYHTDRDVGAASVGEGLLAAYAVTDDTRYLRGAVAAGDYLLGVAEPVGGGLRWPDWADPDGRRSETHYTSFDDGAAGISDFLWRLHEISRERRFRTAAVAGMRWVLSEAAGEGCPRACTWSWTDEPGRSTAYHGVGMGQAGVVWTLDVFADRTGEARFRTAARAGARALRVLTDEGRRQLPEGSERSAASTGFLTGAAGAATMFLERYARDRSQEDLRTARRLLRWLADRAIAERGGLRWPLATGDPASASGFELGAAGIAWANLRAFAALDEPAHRDVARRAGTWLRRVASADGAWAELPGTAGSPTHVGLDSGTAGIGWVLADLASAGVEPSANRTAALAALESIRADARRDRLGPYWYASRDGNRERHRAEPSWHWGAAGIAAFAARLLGWSGRGPGGQPE